MSETFEPYCNEECGRPATHEVPEGVSGDGDYITNWVCDVCDDEGER